jgi:hypothetical protein
MARQRFIHPEIWTDEKFTRLSYVERLFFIGLFSNCDDEGRICASPAYLRSVIFPCDRISLKKVRQIRDAVVQNFSSILLYRVGENEYLAFQNFKKYQKPKYARPSKIPPPQGSEGDFQIMFPEIQLQNGGSLSEKNRNDFSTGSGSGLGSGCGCGSGCGGGAAADIHPEAAERTHVDSNGSSSEGAGTPAESEAEVKSERGEGAAGCSSGAQANAGEACALPAAPCGVQPDVTLADPEEGGTAERAEHPETPGEQRDAAAGGITPYEAQVLRELKAVPGYPFDLEKDLAHIRCLAEDFPGIDLLAEAKRWRAYKLDKPLLKSSKPRLQLRRWCEIAAARPDGARRPKREEGSKHGKSGGDPAEPHADPGAESGQRAPPGTRSKYPMLRVINGREFFG